MYRGLRIEARRLRQEQGKTLDEIALALGVAKSTVSGWVRDIELTPAQIAAINVNKRIYGNQQRGAEVNRERARELRLKQQLAGRLKAREGRPLHMAGCMLYWAEGAKERNGIHFSNSDPYMHLMFMRFLCEELGVLRQTIKLKIVCHAQNDEECRRIEQYWLDLLQVPLTNLGKTFVKPTSTKVHNHLPNGVCMVRVYDTALVSHIFGAIQEYGGFENPEWLF
jgi:transposase-like protein